MSRSSLAARRRARAPKSRQGRKLCRRSAVAAGVALAAAALVIAPPAARAQATRVLVLSVAPPTGWPEAEERVHAELVAAGFAVERRAAEPGAWPPRFDRVAREGLVAIVALSRSPDGTAIELALGDRVTDKMVLRRLAIGDLGSAAAAQVALRVVELLHASLLEVKIRAPTVAVPPAVERRVEGLLASRPEAATAWSLRAALGPSFGLTPAAPELPWQSAVGIAATAAAPRAAAFSLDLRVPLHASRFANAGGVGEVRVLVARAFADWEVRGRLAPFAGIGAGVASVWASGTALAEEARGHERRSWSAVVSARGGVAAAILPWLAVRGFVACSALAPELEFRIVDQTEARLGLPHLEGALSLEVAIPRR